MGHRRGSHRLPPQHLAIGVAAGVSNLDTDPGPALMHLIHEPVQPGNQSVIMNAQLLPVRPARWQHITVFDNKQAHFRFRPPVIVGYQRLVRLPVFAQRLLAMGSIAMRLLRPNLGVSNGLNRIRISDFLLRNGYQTLSGVVGFIVSYLCHTAFSP